MAGPRPRHWSFPLCVKAPEQQFVGGHFAAKRVSHRAVDGGPSLAETGKGGGEEKAAPVS
jgi:hypothetical protein